MRTYRARKRQACRLLMPKSLVKKLRRLGVSPGRYLTAAPVSLDNFRELERRLEAKRQRVEWQSGGIRMLQEKIATLEARLATLPAMQDTADKQRITQLEADLARIELMALREEDLR